MLLPHEHGLLDCAPQPLQKVYVCCLAACRIAVQLLLGDKAEGMEQLTQISGCWQQRCDFAKSAIVVFDPELKGGALGNCSLSESFDIAVEKLQQARAETSRTVQVMLWCAR